MFNFLKDIFATKTRIIAVVSLIVIIAQSHGLDLTKWIGVDWQTTITNILTLITLVAIGDNGNIGGDNNEDNQENNTTVEVTTSPINTIKTAKDEEIKSTCYNNK